MHVFWASKILYNMCAFKRGSILMCRSVLDNLQELYWEYFKTAEGLAT